MKKKLFSTALLIALVGAWTSISAQTTTECNAKTEQCAKEGKDCCKGGKKAHCDKADKGCPSQLCEQYFKGIELTPEQQTQVQALRASLQDDCIAEKTSCDKAACDKADKADRKKAKCDKAENGKCHKERKPDMARKACMKQKRAEFIKGMKDILTPEQYVIFLENVATADPAPHHHGGRPIDPQFSRGRGHNPNASK